MRIIKAGNPKRKENPQRQETMKHVRKRTFTVKYESTKTNKSPCRQEENTEGRRSLTTV